jgi:hypothetical protein
MTPSSQPHFGRIAGSLLLCTLCALAAPAGAQPPSCGQPPEITGRPRIGLALAGGVGAGLGAHRPAAGAGGAAHPDRLHRAHQRRIDHRGRVRVGRLASETEREVVQADWASVFRDTPGREGLSFDRKVQDLRLRAVGARSFDELAIPYRAGTTDISTGEMVVPDRGDLAASMRASMAVPGVFTPSRRTSSSPARLPSPTDDWRSHRRQRARIAEHPHPAGRPHRSRGGQAFELGLHQRRTADPAGPQRPHAAWR